MYNGGSGAIDLGVLTTLVVPAHALATFVVSAHALTFFSKVLSIDPICEVSRPDRKAREFSSGMIGRFRSAA